ncbi:MAG: hypothetical protein LBS57_02685 [Treponema sp.]|jgi:hypothetical protein|nr:hypothetical protein [Treponema sp.]
MKKVFWKGFALCAVLAVMFFTACENGTTDKDPANEGDLVNTVWAGGTPRQDDWLTISFTKLEEAIRGSDEIGYRAVASFSIDNSSNNWGFTYDSEAKSGTVAVASGWNPAPNGFTISADGKTLTITNYGSHSGGSRDFKRLRAGDLSIDPVPFTLETLPADLANSVWAGGTPQGDNTGWLTITFKNLATAIAGSEATGQRVICSFSADNSTNNWGYAYNSSDKTGTITTSGWPFAPSGFTISADGKTLTIPNYGSHDEGSREFKRLR